MNKWIRVTALVLALLLALSSLTLAEQDVSAIEILSVAEEIPSSVSEEEIFPETEEIIPHTEEVPADAGQAIPDENESSGEIAEPVTEVNEGSEETAEPVSDVNEGSKETAEPVPEVNEGPEEIAEPVSEVNEAPEETAEPVSEENEGSEETAEPVSDVNEAEEENAEPVPDGEELPEAEVEAVLPEEEGGDEAPAEGESLPGEISGTAEADSLAAEEISAEPAAELSGGITAIIIPSEMEMQVGEISRVIPEFLPAGTTAGISYGAQPANSMVFHGIGYVLPIREGNVVLTLTAANGVSASCNVTVRPAGVQEYPDYRSLSLPQEVRVCKGESYQFVPGVYPEGAGGPTFYESENPSIAAVDNNGLLIAKNVGTVRISLTYKSGSKYMSTTYSTVHVLPSEDSMEIVDGVLLKYSGVGGDIVIPDGVTAIGDHAFQSATINPITSISIPESVSRIGDYAFANLDQVGYFRLPSGLTYIGDHAFYACRNAGFSDLPAGLTHIGNYAFCETNIGNITIPAGIERISKYAFSGSRQMTRLVIPATVKHVAENAFYGCGNLSDLTIEYGVESIGEDAFGANRALRSVVIPGSVKLISKSLFSWCEGLESIIISEGVEKIEAQAFYECTAAMVVTLPESLTEIDPFTFDRCYGSALVPCGSAAWYFCLDNMIPHDLIGERSEAENYVVRDGVFMGYYGDSTELVIPESAASIYRSPRIPRNVVSVDIPGTIAEIPDRMFYEYDKLASVSLHEGLEIIGDSAFAHCESLRNVLIPNSVTTIKDWGFYYCRNLNSMYIGAGLQHIGWSALTGSGARLYVVANSPAYEYLKNASYNVHPIDDLYAPSPFTIEGDVLLAYTGTDSHVVVPDGIREIGRSAFVSNGLSSVEFPASLEIIGDRAFMNCSNLTSVSIPGTVKKIGDYAFERCTGLKYLTLGEGIETIGSSAFRYCSALERLALPDSVVTLDRFALANCSSLRSVRLSKGLTFLEYDLFESCTALEYVSIPSSVKEIRTSFRGCIALKDVYIPNSVKTIANYAFSDGAEQLVIRCGRNSAAEKYCKKFGIAYSSDNKNPALLDFAGNAVIGVGQTAMLRLAACEETVLGRLSFTSSNTKVVAVDQSSGEISGKRAGSATITVSSENGLKASCKVTVKAAPKKVEFAEPIIVMPLGGTRQLSCVLPKDTAASLSFEANNFFVLSVSPDGLVTAVGTGTAEVVVSTHNGKTAVCTITVVTPPEEIYLDRSEIIIRETLTDQILPSVNEGSYCENYSFTSSDPAVAEVDAEGNIRALSMGTAVITVATYNGVSTECRVSVIAPPPRLELPAALSLGLKESCQLQPEYIFQEGSYSGAYIYASKNARVASVDENGLVTAKKVGSTVISVRTEDGLSAECKVTVLRAPGSIRLTPEKAELGMGEAAKLSWSFPKNSHSGVKFTSSDPSVLEIAPDGAIITRAPGKANVTAETFNGKKDTAEITVWAAPTYVGFVSESSSVLRVCEGQSGVFEIEFGEGEGGSCTFESQYPSSLYVDAKTGKFKAEEIENTYVTVTTYNGLSAKILVSASRAPKKLSLPAASTTLGVGDQYALKPDAGVTNYATNNYNYKSSSTKVATVDKWGVITAHNIGTATITVKTFNGLSVKFKVTVKKAPDAIELNASDLILGNGEKFALAPVFSPSGSGAAVTYTSSNSSILPVSADGVVTARQDYGIAFITATTSNGLSATCRVTLGRAPQYLRITPDAAKLNVGMKLPVGFDLGGGSCSTFYVGSTNPRIADFNARGEVVAKKAGKAQIIVETYNGRRGTMDVTVVAAPKSYTVSLPEKVEIGRSYKLSNYIGSKPAVEFPELLITAASVNNGKAMIMENELGFFLIPLETGAFTLTITTCGGKAMRTKLKAVEPENPMQPEISSPIRSDAVIGDYLGSWKLVSVGAEGYTFPPDALGLGEWGFALSENAASFTIEGESITVSRRMDGSTLLLTMEGSDIACTMHANGMVSIPFADGLTLWFEKQA